jgi:guanine deaminase
MIEKRRLSLFNENMSEAKDNVPNSGESMVFFDTSHLKTNEIYLKLARTSEADPEKRMAPSYHFIICLVSNGLEIGMIDFRVGNTEETFFDGNIGYFLFPSQRGNHYAGKACLMLFDLARMHNMKYLHITCDPDNYASRRTCEWAGGKLEAIIELPTDTDMYARGHRQKCLYYFNLVPVTLTAGEKPFNNKQMNPPSFFLKGDICWTPSPRSLETAENGFLLCDDGKSGGVFKKIPENHAHLPVIDHAGMLIIPGLTDLHVHAPQFAMRALGMDMELLEWLNKNAFPEEAKYAENEYAKKAYGQFVENVKRGPNTRLCVFSTLHVPGTLLLMDLLEESGLVSLVGKVNMDRNCPDYLRESDGAAATIEWLETFYRRRGEGRYKNTSPIITPRFIPSCSDELLEQLAGIQKKYSLPLQSHLSENPEEIEWVRELWPASKNYANAYEMAGLLEGPTVMAHCVWSGEEEMDILAKKGVYIAHCPQSNMNLSSGIAPVRRFLERDIPLGLGSDVAGGAHTSIFRAMGDAIQVSKLLRTKGKALTLEEAFYLGSAGGGAFFGKATGTGAGAAGSFEPGWDFDAVVIDDSEIASTVKRNLRERLERVVYLSDDRHIKAKYVRGNSVF